MIILLQITKCNQIERNKELNNIIPPRSKKKNKNKVSQKTHLQVIPKMKKNSYKIYITIKPYSKILLTL